MQVVLVVIVFVFQIFFVKRYVQRKPTTDTGNLRCAAPSKYPT